MSRPVTALVHGTYGGYQQHRKRGDQPCTPCRAAKAAYQEQWRAASPFARANDRWWNSTRRKALEQLAAEYPGRFTEILNQIRGVS